MMGFGFIWIAIVWFVLIAAAILLGKTLLNRDSSTGIFLGRNENSSALDILKKRYASGEISREDFESMKKEITES